MSKGQLSSGVWGHVPLEIFLHLTSLKSPFLAFGVILAGYWPDFNLESFFFFNKKICVNFMKNLTVFVKTVETSVDACL